MPADGVFLGTGGIGGGLAVRHTRQSGSSHPAGADIRFQGIGNFHGIAAFAEGLRVNHGILFQQKRFPVQPLIGIDARPPVKTGKASLKGRGIVLRCGGGSGRQVAGRADAGALGLRCGKQGITERRKEHQQGQQQGNNLVPMHGRCLLKAPNALAEYDNSRQNIRLIRWKRTCPKGTHLHAYYSIDIWKKQSWGQKNGCK